MTYSEKKSLYESIMNEVTKTVNRRLNESDFLSFLNEDDDNQKFTKFEQSWINAWQGFTKDYIDFKKHVFGAIEDLNNLILKTKKEILENIDYNKNK